MEKRYMLKNKEVSFKELFIEKELLIINEIVNKIGDEEIRNRFNFEVLNNEDLEEIYMWISMVSLKKLLDFINVWNEEIENEIGDICFIEIMDIYNLYIKLNNCGEVF